MIEKKEFERIVSGIEWSEKRLETPRNSRIKFIREFVGMHYQDSGSDRRVVVPFLKLSVGIFLRMLAAKAPQVMIGAPGISMGPMAATFEVAMNEVPYEVKMQEKLRRAVLEAMFSFAVVKCGVTADGQAFGRRTGKKFMDIVSIDDLVIDMSAPLLEDIEYIGNKYWIDYEDVKRFEDYDARDGITPDEYVPHNEVGTERAEAVQIPGPPEGQGKRVHVCDLYLPKRNIMLTYAITSKKILKQVNWGKRPKPYLMLGFDEVPGNLLPVAPAAVWYDLHILANRLFRKLGSQADGQKNVLGFDGGNPNSVNDFKDAHDGDGITYTGTKPELLQTPGPDQMTINMFMLCREMYSFFSGNLESLGGLAPVADTLGQDRLISQASSAQVRDMADRVVDFAEDIFRTLAYYEWNDPIKERKLMKPVKGTDISVPVLWSMRERFGEFDQFNFSINVYSMQDDSPAAQLQKLSLIMREYVAPMMPMLEAAGGMVDVQKIMQKVAHLSNTPWLAEIVRFADKSESDQSSESGGATASPSVTRNERVSYNGGPTAQGQNKIMQQIMAGGGNSGPKQG